MTVLQDVRVGGEGNAAAIEFSRHQGQYQTDPASSECQCLLVQHTSKLSEEAGHLRHSRLQNITPMTSWQGHLGVTELSAAAVWPRWLILPTAEHRCRAPVLRARRASFLQQQPALLQPAACQGAGAAKGWAGESCSCGRQRLGCKYAKCCPHKKRSYAHYKQK